MLLVEIPHFEECGGVDEAETILTKPFFFVFFFWMGGSEGEGMNIYGAFLLTSCKLGTSHSISLIFNAYNYYYLFLKPLSN